MSAVYKRELRSYFTSMVGYVFIAVVIFFTGVYFMAYNIFNGYPSFGYTLLSATLVFMVAIPILTMRSMAEDKKNKTDQMLMTAPVSLTGVVLGKYLAMVTVLAIPMALLCLCPVIIAWNGTTVLAVDYASILAFFLMGCVFIAVGMLLSALTESQIIAAVGTFAVLLVLYLWTDLISFLPDTLAGWLGVFDFQGVLENFAYYDVFDLGGLILYLTLAAFFVFLTVQSLRRRRGITSAATVAVVAAIAVVINLVVGQLPSNLLERDLSDNSLYTVSDTSAQLLAALEIPVELVVLQSKENTDERITKFLYNYAALSDQVSLSFIDPVEHPSALEEYGGSQNTVVVSCAQTGKQKIVAFSDMLVMDYMSYYYYGSTSYTEFDADGQLTSAVDYVTGENGYMIYTAENHGESDLGTAVTDTIEKANLSTGSVSLLMDGGVPEDCSLLVFNQPTTDMSDDERTMTEEYLSRGGQVMILLSRTDLPNFNALLGDYGLSVAQGYIGDGANYYGQYGAFYFSATLSSSSAVTSGFDSDSLTMIYGAHGMTRSDPVRDTISVDAFMTTTANGYSDADGETGTYLLGAAATEEVEDGVTARLTVFTAESVIDEQVISYYPSMVNLDLFMNALTAGFDDVSNISIPAKSLETTYNTFTNAGLWSMLYLAIIPLATLGGGLIYWLNRRKR